MTPNPNPSPELREGSKVRFENGDTGVIVRLEYVVQLDEPDGTQGLMGGSVGVWTGESEHFAGLSPQTLQAPGEVEPMAQTLEVHAETRRLCGQFGVADELDAAAKMLRSLATVAAANDEGVFAIGDRVEKIKGSSWCGIIVGTYSTKLTPEGYAVESEREPGSVQIYPAAAIRLLSQGEGKAAE